MRNEKIFLQRQLGMTFAGIGRKYGVTGHRARQIVENHGRAIRNDVHFAREVEKLDYVLSPRYTPLLIDLLRELSS